MRSVAILAQAPPACACCRWAMFDDLDDLCDTIDRLEGQAPPNEREPGGAPAPVSAPARLAAEDADFTLEKALRLQEELLDRFSGPDFQEKRAELERRYGRGYEGLDLGGEGERSRLYLSVQREILPKYGFHGSHEGVLSMLAAAARHNGDALFDRNRLKLNRLLGLAPTESEAENERRATAALARGARGAAHGTELLGGYGSSGPPPGKGAAGPPLMDSQAIRDRLSLLPMRTAAGLGAAGVPVFGARGGQGPLAMGNPDEDM